MSKKEQIQIGKDSGRVKVYVRIRPFNREENTSRTQQILQVSEDNSKIFIAPENKGKVDKVFKFDHVFTSTKTNQQVCDQLSNPIVTSALKGFNGTLMAYGQTGTGKTHTLMAPDGITHDVIHKVFDSIHGDKKHEYKVSASYLQVYQEKIHDLLNINTKIELSIREKPKAGIYVENLTEYVIRSPSEAFSLITFGKRRLVFAETKMNRTSSRSHSVFQLTIEKAPKKDKYSIDESPNKELRKVKPSNKGSTESLVQMMCLDEEVIVKGKIHLCDLAGSERVKKTHASGERLSEAQHINSSLLELGNVIQALADDKKTHIPFRNSVLTRLLQESLGGNCKTSLIVCVSPSSKDLSETKSTLNFGSRAMKITNTAYVNMEVDFKRLSDSLLEKLEAQENELVELRKKSKKDWQTEKKAMMEEVEKIASESESVIKSLKSMYENQVNELTTKLNQLEYEISSKDALITNLRNEINSLQKTHDEEDKIAKMLLLNELTSLQFLTASESDRWLERNSDIDVEAREALTLGLIEHSLSLQNYSSLFHHEATIFSEASVSEDTSNCKILNSNELKKMRYEHLKAVLVQNKTNLMNELSKISHTFGNRQKKQDMEMAIKKNSLLELCEMMIDKGFLASQIAIENHELRKKLATEVEQKAMNIDGNELKMNEGQKEEVRRKVEGDLQKVDHFAAKLTNTLEDPTDIDKKFSKFEFTLSKIEDILAEEMSNEQKQKIISEKLRKRRADGRLKQIGESDSRKINVVENKKVLRHCKESEKGAIKRAQINAETQTTQGEEVNTVYIKKDGFNIGMEANENEGMIKKTILVKDADILKSITEKQEENLLRFTDQSQGQINFTKINGMPAEKYIGGYHKRIPECDLMLEFESETKPRLTGKEKTHLNSFDLPIEETDEFSKLISEVEKMEDAINECIVIEKEIEHVKAKIATSKAKIRKEGKNNKIEKYRTRWHQAEDMSGFDKENRCADGNMHLVDKYKMPNMTRREQTQKLKNNGRFGYVDRLLSSITNYNPTDLEKCVLENWPLPNFEHVCSFPSALLYRMPQIPVMQTYCFDVCCRQEALNHCYDIQVYNNCNEVQPPLHQLHVNRTDTQSMDFESFSYSQESSLGCNQTRNMLPLQGSECRFETEDCDFYPGKRNEQIFHVKDCTSGIMNRKYRSSCKQDKSKEVKTFTSNEHQNELFCNLEDKIIENPSKNELTDEHQKELLPKHPLSKTFLKTYSNINNRVHTDHLKTGGQNSEVDDEMKKSCNEKSREVECGTKGSKVTNDDQIRKRDNEVIVVGSNSSKVSNDDEIRKRDKETILKHDLCLLEVQIASGVHENCYGDSFKSPLDINEDDEIMKTFDASCDLEEARDFEQPSMDVKEEQRDVVIKKTWSLSNWLWRKKKPRYTVNEVSVVLQ